MTTILIIDDNDLVRSSTRYILEDDGFKVEEAPDGEVGIKVVASIKPDLVLTDIVMPNKEGIELIRELRAGGYVGPILAMSGGGRIESGSLLSVAKKLGATDCIAKPFNKAQLLEKVKACLAGAAG